MQPVRMNHLRPYSPLPPSLPPTTFVFLLLCSAVFFLAVQVRNDEWEHVKTMKALQHDVSVERQ